MDKSKRVVEAFLNSGENYFHKKRILQERVKVKPPQEKDGWDYLDIRDITKFDLDNIIACALNCVDEELYTIIPETALNAALGFSIQTLGNGKYQNKIDSKTYDMLLKVLSLKYQERCL
jgi:hypothetical protein